MSGLREIEFHTAIEVGGVPLSVFYWLADTQGCGTYRCIQPAKTLARKHKVQVEAGGISTNPYTMLIAQRTHKPDAVEFLEQIVKTRSEVGAPVPKIVYETDDDLWSIEKDNPGYDYYMGNNVEANSKLAIALSDAVTVSTEPLAEIMRRYNDNVYVSRNAIPKKYLNEIAYPYQVGSLDKPFVMAYSGSATHINDFKQCVSSVNFILKMYPNSRMVFFGTDYSNLLDGSVQSQCRVAPWVNGVAPYLELLSRAQVDVVLAPLRPSKFNESKSNLRLIESSGLGIPVVATAWGPYSSDKDPGALYVQPGESWVAPLIAMMDPLTRMEHSTVGRDWVRNRYVQEDAIDDLLGIYKEVLSQ